MAGSNIITKMRRRAGSLLTNIGTGLGGDVAETVQPDKTPTMAEVASVRKDLTLFGQWQTYLENPNLIFQQGFNLDVFEVWRKMRTDGHLLGCETKRILAPVGRDWQVMPGRKSGEKSGQYAVDLVTDNLNRALTPSVRMAMGLFVSFGFKPIEIMWARDGAQYAISKLVERRADRFRFDIDGNLLLLTTENPMGEKMPWGKFCTPKYCASEGNPYGMGILNAVYWPWFINRNNWIAWAIYNDRVARPPLKAQHPSGAPPETVKNLERAMAALYNNAGITFETGWLLELIETKGTASGGAYETLHSACEAKIAKAYTGETLTSSEGQHGTQALGSVHNDVRHELIEADCRLIEEFVNDEIIEPLCYYNDIADDDIPYLWFNTDEEEDLNALATRDKTLKDSGLRIPVSYMYDKYGIPEPQGDEEVLAAAPAAPAGTVPPGAPGQAPMMTPAQMKKAMKAADVPVQFAETPLTTREQLAVENTDRMWWLSERGTPMFVDKYELVRAAIKKALAKADGFDALKTKIKTLATDAGFAGLIEPEIFRAMVAGADACAMEVDRKKGLSPAVTQFAEGDATNVSWNWEQGLTFQEAVDWWVAHVNAPVAVVEGIAEAATEKAFYVSGVEDEYLLKKLGGLIETAIANGTTYATFAEDAAGIFKALGVDALDPWHLETVYRTNVMEAFRNGKVALLTDPDIQTEFPAFRRIGILDNAIRPEHRAENGVIKLASDPYWKTFWGYNCRCTFVPATVEEARAAGLNV